MLEMGRVFVAIFWGVFAFHTVYCTSCSSPVGQPELLEPPAPSGECYISTKKTGPGELKAKIEETVALFTAGYKEPGDCEEPSGVTKIEKPDDFISCSTDVLEDLTSYLSDFTKVITWRLWQVASQSDHQPTPADISNLVRKKTELINGLKDIRVYQGSSKGPTWTLTSYSVPDLEKALDSVLDLLQKSPTTSMPKPEPAKTILLKNPAPLELKKVLDQCQELMESVDVEASIARGFTKKGSEDAIFREALAFITRLDSVERQVAGYSALYEQLQKSRQVQLTIQDLLPIAKKVVDLHGASVVQTLSVDLRSKFTKLFGDLGALDLVGVSSNCVIVNVAYNRSSVFQGKSRRGFMYLVGTPSEKYQRVIEAQVVRNSVVYQIRAASSDDLLYATNSDVEDSSRRRVIILHGETRPRKALTDWKLEADGDAFIIKNAELDEYLFADNQVDEGTGLRPVFLARRDFQGNVSHAVDAGRWKFEC